VLLLVVSVVLALALLIAPVLLLHRHYDVAIDGTRDHLERYRRVAAQAPETKKALETLQAKNGRRFFLKNTAPNLAGAELQDLVRAAIERRPHHDRADRCAQGRWASARRQCPAIRIDTQPAKDFMRSRRSSPT
jgi:hypothetical protein